MDITFLDKTSFKIKFKTATVVTEAGILVIENALGVKKTIERPGEYEVAGVSVMGFRTEGRYSVFTIEADKLNIVFMGDFSGKLNDKLIDAFGDVDMVLTNTKDGTSEGVRLEPYFLITSDESVVKDSGLVVEKLPKFLIKKEDILEDQNTKAIVLERK